MPRPQFTLRALLVAMLVMGAFFGGVAIQGRLDAPRFRIRITESVVGQTVPHEFMMLPDGTTWTRDFSEPADE